MAHPEYVGDWIDFGKNIDALVGHLEACVRELEDQRARIESSPNHPELLAYQIKAIDDRLEPLRLKVLAANEGYYLFDPRALSGGDQASQRWVAMARKAGKLLHPHQFGESLHAAEEEKASPLKVIRGGNGARDLGSPTMSVR